jgi:hypothetical protein
MPQSRTTTAAKAGFFKAAIDIYMHGLIAKTQETQTAQMKCYAGNGRRRAFYDEGTVSSCENLGADRQPARFRLELPEALVVAGDESARQKAADGCFCTHESNSYYPSLPFNPGHLIQIKKLEREMKKARKAIDRVNPEPEGVTAAGF